MALLSKRNSFFSYEESDVEVSSEPLPESEVADQVNLENEIDSEVATVEEEAEVVDSLAEQAVDNATLIEQAPEEVTEEIVTESNKHYLLALGRLGMGTDNLRYIKVGTESKLTPLENLKINQEGIWQTIKDFFVRVWNFIKNIAGKIKNFFLGVGRSIKNTASRAKALLGRGYRAAKGFVFRKSMPLEAFASLLAENGKTTATLDDIFELGYRGGVYKKKELSGAKPIPGLIERSAAKLQRKDVFLQTAKLNGQSTQLVFLTAENDEFGANEVITVDTPKVDEKKVEDIIKNIITNESTAKALLGSIDKKLETRQTQDAKAIEKRMDDLKKEIEAKENELKAVKEDKEASKEDAQKVKDAMKQVKSKMKILGYMNQGQVYVAKVVAALVDNLQAANKEAEEGSDDKAEDKK